jgi:phosphate/sulfate permease
VRNDVILVLVVITALAFDFTNGFHDTGNAMATSIATGALHPRIAVALSGVLNLVGAFLSLAVAATIANGLVDTGDVTLTVVAAGLAGGIIWNLLTWLFGIPSSSSHALIGGMIGSTIAAGKPADRERRARDRRGTREREQARIGGGDPQGHRHGHRPSGQRRRRGPGPGPPGRGRLAPGQA